MDALFAAGDGVDGDPGVSGGRPGAGGEDRHGVRAGRGIHRSRRAVHVHAVGRRLIFVLTTACQTHAYECQQE